MIVRWLFVNVTWWINYVAILYVVYLIIVLRANDANIRGQH